MKRSKKLLALVLVMTLVVGILAGCGNSAPAAAPSGETAAAEKVSWKMVSCWGDGTGMYEIDKKFVQYVTDVSGGNFEITLFPAGQLCDATGVLEYVMNGTAELGGDWAGYWTGYNTAFDLLGSNVYGFTNYDYNLWIYKGGGQELFDEIYGQYGLKYFPTGISAMEAGIWANKPISTLKDLAGSRVRFAGLIQGKIAEKIGMAPVTISVSELYEALQRGTIDACEYSIPSNNLMMNLQEVCKYWLAPGWHQTSSVYGTMVNKAAYEKLSPENQKVLQLAAQLANQYCTLNMQYLDAEATNTILSQGVTKMQLTDAEMQTIYKAKQEAAKELCDANPDYKKVFDSQEAYKKLMAEYRSMQGEWAVGAGY